MAIFLTSLHLSSNLPFNNCHVALTQGVAIEFAVVGAVNRKGGYVKSTLQFSEQLLIIIGLKEVQLKWRGGNELVLYGNIYIYIQNCPFRIHFGYY